MRHVVFAAIYLTFCDLQVYGITRSVEWFIAVGLGWMALISIAVGVIQEVSGQ